MGPMKPKDDGSPSYQVKHFLLYSGKDGMGSRAHGVSRHDSKVRLPHGRDVSVGKVHSYNTMLKYIRGATAFAEYCLDCYGESSVFAMLKRPEWGRAWLVTLQERDLSSSTVSGYLDAVLKLVEVVAPGRRAAWYTLRNEVPTRPATKNRAWSAVEIDRLIAMVGTHSPEMGLILRFIDATGARAGEVVRHVGPPADASARRTGHWDHALHVGQLRNDQVLLVGKGGKRRLLAVPTDLAIEIRERIDPLSPADYVFTITYQQLHHQVTLACEVLGIREDGVHALRYAFAQRTYDALLRDGVSAAEAERRVSIALGHERASITRRYLGTR